MTEREFLDRVDDSILSQVTQLAKLRDIPIRAALADFRASCVENAEFDDIWSLRIDRCDLINAEPNDHTLRLRARAAAERDR